MTRRTTTFYCIALAVVFLSVVPCLSANDTLPWKRLVDHPKLSLPETILNELSSKDDTTHVIVHCAGQAADGFPHLMMSCLDRQGIRNSIRRTMDDVSTRMEARGIAFNHRYDYFPAFSATVTLDDLEILTADDAILTIEPDRVLMPHTTQGIPLMEASAVRNVYGGQGVAIAICDTGIDYTHEQLGGGGFPNAKVIGGYDFGGSVANRPSSQDHDPMDTLGHGTSCAGIAAGDISNDPNYSGGVANHAKLYALKISADGQSSAYESDLLAAWEWCITHKNDDPEHPIVVISTSYGGGSFTGTCDSFSAAVTQSATNVINAGITLFASSGNDGSCGSLSWPACMSNVISVGAVFDTAAGSPGFCVDGSSCADNIQANSGCPTGYATWTYNTTAGQVIPYTNVSEQLDLFAPSYPAATTRLGGGITTTFGGTSAACPYAAGVATVMQSAYKNVTGSLLIPAQIKDRISTFGKPVTYAPAGITRPLPCLSSTDIDGDFLPAGWEISHFGTLEQDGQGDPDNDGLTNLEEYQWGTDPTNPDTDGDSYTDGWEIIAGTDPLDPSSFAASVSSMGPAGMFCSVSFLLFLGWRALGGRRTESH